MAERTPPDSPHVRSGVSSFSHISSPASYQFSCAGDASDEEGSSWSSDEVFAPLLLAQRLLSWYEARDVLWERERGVLVKQSACHLHAYVRKPHPIHSHMSLALYGEGHAYSSLLLG